MKNIFQKSNLLVIIFAWISLTCQSQNLSKDSVRNDFIKAEIDIPTKYITSEKITLLEFPDIAFAHLRYKRYEEAFMPCTYVAIYRKQADQWQFVKVIPYNYKMEKVGDQTLLFLSNNEFCGMTGICSYYSQISYFINDTMENLVKFPGYDYIVNYEYRIFSEDEDYKPLQGDTVLNKKTISNVVQRREGIITYDLLSEIGILKGVNKGSLIIDRVSRKDSLIEVDIQKAIVESQR